MLKRIRYFKFKANEPLPDETIKLFVKELGKRHYLTFDYGSEREKEFMEHCKKIGRDYYQFSELVVTGKDISLIPFFYLFTENDKNYHQEILLEPGSECGYDGDIYCKAGGKQIWKVAVDSRKVKKLDILLVPIHSWVKIFIITRALKEIFEQEEITGYRTVPCLTAGNDYSEKERLLDFTNKRLEREATHYQLIVTGKTRRPETVIGTECEGYKCEKCGVLYNNSLTLADVGFSYYQVDDFSDGDFQISIGRKYEGGSRIFWTLTQKVLISGKALQLFLGNKMRGIFHLSKDPPRKYPVVEILNVTCDEALLEEARRLYIRK